MLSDMTTTRAVSLCCSETVVLDQAGRGSIIHKITVLIFDSMKAIKVVQKRKNLQLSLLYSQNLSQ